MTYDRWYENLPFGPLTREAHDSLSLAYYDGGGLNDVAQYAKRRGVGQGDYLRAKFAELAVKIEAELPVSETVSEPTSSADMEA